MNTEKVKNVMLSMQRFSWEQGMAGQALFEIGEDEMAILFANEAIHRGPDGRLGTTHADSDQTDCGSNGVPVWWAYLVTGKEKYREAADRMAEYFLTASRASNGIIYHNRNIPQTLIDGIYHLAPVLTLTGHLDFAMDQFRRFREVHLDPETGLFHQIWNEELKGFSKAAFWGCGVGWILAAYSLTGLCLPEDAKEERKTLAGWLKEGTDAFLRYLTPKGLTYDFLDDPETFEQTAAITMVIYAIYRGIQAGLLGEEYKDVADRLYAVMESYIDEDGYLQEGCNAPTFDCSGVSTEDQAFALMCMAAKKDLEEGRQFRFMYGQNRE